MIIIFSNQKLNLQKHAIIIFVAAIAIQTFHMVEHIAQLYQHTILDLSIKDSNGWIAELNLEWIHWIYNFVYFILLAIVAKELSFFTLKNRTDGQRIAMLSFDLALFLQGYHLLEHTVRMFQYYLTGCTPCSGVLGVYFDGVYLHFVLNFLVYVYPLAAFFILGIHKKFVKEIFLINRKS